MKRKFTLIGHPLGHTLSPVIHERLFELSGEDAEYGVSDIAKLNEAPEGYDGYNVTIPYKTAIIPFLTRLDETAQSIGAVNCVVCRNGEKTGYNTDCTGFMRSLEAEGLSLSGRVLLLGIGGAGRMMAAECLKNGAMLTVAARNTEKAKATVAEVEKSFGGHIEITTFENIAGEYDLCLNSTPVGMFPNTDASPIGEDAVRRCKALFDAVYNPTPTKLMTMFEKQGKKAVGGMAMLVWQAVAAHEIWDDSRYDEKDIFSLITELSEAVK